MAPCKKNKNKIKGNLLDCSNFSFWCVLVAVMMTEFMVFGHSDHGTITYLVGDICGGVKWSPNFVAKHGA